MKLKNQIVACSHEAVLLNAKTRNIIIKYLMQCIKPHKDEFDAFVCSGYSMSLIVPILATRLHKNLIIVAKDGEERHSQVSYGVEGHPCQRVCFVDDLINSGQTYKYVKEQLEYIDCEIVSYCLYHDRGFRSYEWDDKVTKPAICWNVGSPPSNQSLLRQKKLYIHRSYNAISGWAK